SSGFGITSNGILSKRAWRKRQRSLRGRGNAARKGGGGDDFVVALIPLPIPGRVSEDAVVLLARPLGRSQASPSRSAHANHLQGSLLHRAELDDPFGSCLGNVNRAIAADRDIVNGFEHRIAGF